MRGVEIYRRERGHQRGLPPEGGGHRGAVAFVSESRGRYSHHCVALSARTPSRGFLEFFPHVLSGKTPGWAWLESRPG